MVYMNRLEAIASLIDKCDTLADVGTDHGYIAEMALKANLCKKVIATDINKGPLNSAINHLTKFGFNNLVDFRLGSGLAVINKNEVDCAVIAGMGGELIANILEESKNISKSINSFVLQAMTNLDVIRKYLYDNGYTISEEIIVKEYHHYYFIIKAIQGASTSEDDIYYEISKYLLDKKDTLLLEYIKKTIDLNDKILLNLKNSAKQDNSSKIEELKNKSIKLNEIIARNYM
jgi:tRNA (adenine22-N1)-methyltransferase